MWSIIDANVVDLPEPVGPVTRIKPLGLSAVFLTISGKPRVSNAGTILEIVRKAAAKLPLSL